MTSTQTSASTNTTMASLTKDYANLTLKATLAGKSGVYGLTVMSNSFLASGSTDGRIRIWNVSNQSVITTLLGHASRIRSLIMLENGILASGSEDKTIKFWNLETGQCTQTLRGHTGTVINLLFI